MAETKTHYRAQQREVAERQMTLSEYLQRCAELGIQRVEPGTVEFVAWPGPRVK